jgi:TolB protein
LIGVPSQIWYSTSLPAKMGYIRPINLARPLIEEARLRLRQPEPTPPPPPPSGLVVGGRAYVTEPDGVNFRTGPGLALAVLWKAPYNTRVTLLAGPQWADAIPWYQVSVDEIGLIGWCSGNYLQPIPSGEPVTEALIAFASNRTGNYDIYVMRPDGSAVQNLTQHPAKDGDPSWSPDRRWIAFSSDRGGDADIYLLDLGGGLNPPMVIAAIQGAGDQIHPVWSRDGRRLAYVSNEDGDWEIFISQIDGSGKRQLTYNSAWDSFPTWSPDGRQIVFTSARDGNFELYAVDVETGAERRLTNNPASDAFPAYSHDGSRIVFVSARTGLLELYVADPRNVEGTLVRLTDSRAAPQYNRYPDWSPDGRWIVFTSWRDGQGEIYRISAAGGALTRLTSSPGDDEQVAWNQ